MAETKTKLTALSKSPNRQSEELFNTSREVKSTHTSELVIALCGPIGSPLHKVADTLRAILTTEFGYDKCEILRLSKIIEEYSKGEIIPSEQYAKVTKLIQLGDDLRESYGSSILAELAVNKIVLDRQKAKASAPKYEARRVCHIIDSIKNQEELDILRLVYRDMLYFIGVFSPMPIREKSLEKRGMSLTQIYELIDKDSGEELAHGQTVRDTFPQADFFLRIDSDTDTQIKGKVERFLHLILGTKIITPSPFETAMYQAASAAGNSACLSRQVGAALTDEVGEVISVGWNDVPKAGGNLYTADPTSDPAGDADKRCWNLEGGTCFNDAEKNTISELLVSDLISKGLLDASKKEEAVNRVIKNSKLKGLIEFSRAIHAEMHAIILGSQLGGTRVKNGKLFITTYPCHSCARHIIAAGIKEVYYIEPYRKSLATKLHDDAITESETDARKVRILPYDGVAPTRYLKLFRMQQNSRKVNGKMPLIDFKTASPKFDKTLEALPTLEAIVVKGLQAKHLIPEAAPNGE